MNARNDAQFSREVRTLAQSVGFHDPAYRGELASLFDGPGRKRKYLRRAGVTVDDFGELLFDRRLTFERLDVSGVLALLGTVFDGTSTTRKRARGGPSKSAILSEIDAQADRAKRNRLRKSVCETCRAIGYSSAIVTLEHCGTIMRRVDPTFSEVMQQTIGMGGNE